MSVPGRELAEEEVRKFINRHLDMFCRVQFSQMIHLRCFTDTDRQKIRASCTHEGNNETTFVFFERLCCREGWVPLFVEALREQNMNRLADMLENLYRSNLLPPPTPRPAAPTPPAANRPSAPPAESGMFAQALGWSPARSPAPSANLPPQDTGHCWTPVQENSHPAEKSKLATTDKGGEPGVPSTSDVSSASNVGAAVGNRASESPDPYPVKEDSASVPVAVEERPLSSETISTSMADNVEQKWDGRQHRPVTVKNGRFGNAHRPEDSGTGSVLPAVASGNQPEEDYYSSDSVLLALGDRREASPVERKVHVLRGDRERENPPVVASPLDAPRTNLPAPEGSPEKRTLPLVDPSSRSAPANDAQPLLPPRTGTKPPLPVPDTVPKHPIRLPPSDLDGSSSVETKSPKSRQGDSAAGGERPSGDFKLPMEETTGRGAPAGRPPWGMETWPSAVGDRQRDSRIFHSNCSENDVPCKPGVLSSVHAAELHSDDAGKTSNMYSGSSERLCMSNGDSASVSTSDSDPILLSERSSGEHSTTSTTGGRNWADGAVDATLPPEVDTGEEDASVRSFQVLVKEGRSVDLMGAPTDGAPLRPSPDSASDGQPLNKDRDYHVTSDSSWRLWALAVALLASAAFLLYKKK